MNLWRVSMVESFRRWEADEEADTDRLLADLRGEGEASERMRAGTAFHKALELGLSGETIQVNGYTFHIRDDIALALPEIRELRGYRTYVVDGEPIVITGQVDGIDGVAIYDHKTTGRFDAERYFEGYQWRLYLDIFGADVFRWNVFEVADTEDPMVWEVLSLHLLVQYRYPKLGEDCQNLVQRFARFVREQAFA
jgi:hypothetical protein